MDKLKTPCEGCKCEEDCLVWRKCIKYRIWFHEKWEEIRTAAEIIKEMRVGK